MVCSPRWEYCVLKVRLHRLSYVITLGVFSLLGATAETVSYNYDFVGSARGDVRGQQYAWIELPSVSACRRVSIRNDNSVSIAIRPTLLKYDATYFRGYLEAEILPEPESIGNS